MFSTKVYTVPISRPYLEVSNLISDNVIVVDRNGIGVQHITYFPGSETVDVKTYEWYGVKTETATFTNSLTILSNTIIGSDREIIIRVGSAPVPGYVFSIYYGSIIASYLIQSGDTTEDVRDALIAAIDNESWGTTVVATAIGLNRFQIDISGTTVDMLTKIGTQKYKKGYYVTIVGINYIIEEKVDTNTWPTLSTLGLSYAYSLLFTLPGSVESYLTEPNSTYSYNESITGSTAITGIPSASSVPYGQCVVDQYQQRIWFPDDLGYGELIKIFQK
jgi:hypothetical protein